MHVRTPSLRLLFCGLVTFALAACSDDNPTPDPDTTDDVADTDAGDVDGFDTDDADDTDTADVEDVDDAGDAADADTTEVGDADTSEVGDADTTEVGDADTSEVGDTDADTDTDTGVDADVDADADTDVFVEPCGNGTLDDDEECDDGNTSNGDGCASDCTLEPFCGDGDVGAGEACDDGNNDDGDGCAADCSIEGGEVCARCDEDAECGGEDDLCVDLTDGSFCTIDCSADDSVCEDDEECVDIVIGEVTLGRQCVPLNDRCTTPGCGDGYLDDGEECDDGGLVDGDGCAAGCTIEPFCGDGTRDVELDEGCDDGNTVDGDGCAADCTIEPICGNGSIEAPEEECDDGNTRVGDGCDDECQIESFCGDGILDDDEECDDGNTANGDGCDDECVLEPVCGDGEVEAPEECDDGNTTSGDGCDENCIREPDCGDDIRDPGEQCDDGNTDDGDGCAADCSLEDDYCSVTTLTEATLATPIFGDTTNAFNVYDGECGNDGAGDTAITFTAPYAGQWQFDTFGSLYDTVLRVTDTCFGDEIVCNDDASDTIARSVVIYEMEADETVVIVVDGKSVGGPFRLRVNDYGCGNGFLNFGEQCEDGNTEDGDGCAADCTREPVCGDTFIDGDEECDDGNTEDGDGCDSSCAIERICGDGNLVVDEECDDANTENGDGCNDECQLECGDGIWGPGEECDDGNNESGDGCSRTCVIEHLCGDDFAEPGEQCDDGNTSGTDLCNSACYLQGAPFDSGGRRRSGFLGNQSHYFTFTAHDATDVRFETTNELRGCNGDTVLEITDGSTIVAANDDSDDAAPGCSLLETSLAPGDYELVVSSGTTVGIDPIWVLGEVSVRIDGTGNYFGGLLGELESLELETLGEAYDDFDTYLLTLDEATTIIAHTGDGVSACPGDTVMTLESFDDGDGSWSEVGTNDDAAGLGVCSLLDEDLEAGDYRIRVSSPEPIEDYTLFVAYVAATCGDGTLDEGEECDDGNVLPWDGCSAGCTTEFVCGDGATAGLEECDDGNNDDGDGCSATCVLEWICGDGTRDPIEECDDGNADDGDGCDAACEYEHFCGNRNPEPGEQCDDGNRRRGDGCNALCYTEGLQIDDGGVFSGGFSTGGRMIYSFVVHHDTTNFTAFTSDGGFACPGDTAMALQSTSSSDEWTNDNAAGRGLCSELDVDLTPGSYNLVVDGPEEIDPFWLTAAIWVDIVGPGDYLGGVAPGGVDTYRMTIDSPQILSLETSTGEGACSANTRISVYDADDGSLVFDDDDGGINLCSAILDPVEPGSYVIEVENLGAISATYTLAVGLVDAGCGDGLLVAPEECDDGNTVNGDGCGATCLIEHTCGNDTVETGEQCDGGNTIDGDGCNSACYVEGTTVDGGGDFVAGFGEDSELIFEITIETDPTHAIVWTSDGAGGCPGNTVLEILDSEGTQVAFNDDSQEVVSGFCSYIETDLAPGDYTVVVSGFDGAAIDPLVLSTAVYVEVDGPGTYFGGVPIGSNDTFVFTLDEPTVVRFETSDGAGGCGSDTRMTLWTSEYEYVAEDDNGGVGTCSLLVGNFGPGDFVLDIRGFVFSAVDDYQLDIEYFDPDTCPNYLVEDGEECDDGNADAGDGCDASCMIED